MHNQIVASTAAALANLDAQTLADARASVRVRSLESTGEELGLEDAISLIIGAKVLSAADGLSTAEETGLKLLMRKYALPDAVIKHVLEFDTSRVTPAQLGELAPARSRKACFMLSGMIAIAGIDGLSDEELAQAREAGATLGLEPKLVALIVAEAKASVYAMLKGDRSLLSHLMDVRRAIFSFVE
jgi:hypothetical protein